MINSSQFVNCVWMATVLILLGLVPGLFRDIAVATERIAAQINFFGSPLRLAPAETPRNFSQPRFFAVAGFLLLAVGSFAYLAR